MKAAVPILLTSGTLDPVTPPENGDTIARTLSHSLHVRVPSAGHSPFGLTGLECLDGLKRAFIERGRSDGPRHELREPHRASWVRHGEVR